MNISKKYISICIGVLISMSTAYAQRCLNIKYKLRGYFYAGTSQADSTALGGFYQDDNRPKKINAVIENISTPNTFQIRVQSDSLCEFKKRVKGFKIFVCNRTDSIISLPAQDSRLYLKRQVFYKKKWRDIEYLPSSWCGNSYHNVYINPKEYWDFTAPCLSGKIQAKFRFELYISENLTIYSNEFEGSFNKKQLKKEQGHRRTGLMDSYNN